MIDTVRHAVRDFKSLPEIYTFHYYSVLLLVDDGVMFNSFPHTVLNPTPGKILQDLFRNFHLHLAGPLLRCSRQSDMMHCEIIYRSVIYLHVEGANELGKGQVNLRVCQTRKTILVSTCPWRKPRIDKGDTMDGILLDSETLSSALRKSGDKLIKVDTLLRRLDPALRVKAMGVWKDTRVLVDKDSTETNGSLCVHRLEEARSRIT